MSSLTRSPSSLGLMVGFLGVLALAVHPEGSARAETSSDTCAAVSGEGAVRLERIREGERRLDALRQRASNGSESSRELAELACLVRSLAVVIPAPKDGDPDIVAAHAFRALAFQTAWHTLAEIVDRLVGAGTRTERLTEALSLAEDASLGALLGLLARVVQDAGGAPEAPVLETLIYADPLARMSLDLLGRDRTLPRDMEALVGNAADVQGRRLATLWAFTNIRLSAVSVHDPEALTATAGWLEELATHPVVAAQESATPGTIVEPITRIAAYLRFLREVAIDPVVDTAMVRALAPVVLEAAITGGATDEKRRPEPFAEEPARLLRDAARVTSRGEQLHEAGIWLRSVFVRAHAGGALDDMTLASLGSRWSALFPETEFGLFVPNTVPVGPSVKPAAASACALPDIGGVLAPRIDDADPPAPLRWNKPPSGGQDITRMRAATATAVDYLALLATRTSDTGGEVLGMRVSADTSLAEPAATALACTLDGFEALVTRSVPARRGCSRVAASASCAALEDVHALIEPEIAALRSVIARLRAPTESPRALGSQSLGDALKTWADAVGLPGLDLADLPEKPFPSFETQYSAAKYTLTAEAGKRDECELLDEAAAKAKMAYIEALDEVAIGEVSERLAELGRANAEIRARIAGLRAEADRLRVAVAKNMETAESADADARFEARLLADRLADLAQAEADALATLSQNVRTVAAQAAGDLMKQADGLKEDIRRIKNSEERAKKRKSRFGIVKAIVSTVGAALAPLTGGSSSVIGQLATKALDLGEKFSRRGAWQGFDNIATNLMETLEVAGSGTEALGKVTSFSDETREGLAAIGKTFVHVGNGAAQVKAVASLFAGMKDRETRLNALRAFASGFDYDIQEGTLAIAWDKANAIEVKLPEAIREPLTRAIETGAYIEYTVQRVAEDGKTLVRDAKAWVDDTRALARAELDVVKQAVKARLVQPAKEWLDAALDQGESLRREAGAEFAAAKADLERQFERLAGPEVQQVVGVMKRLLSEESLLTLTSSGHLVSIPAKVRGFRGKVEARVEELRRLSPTEELDSLRETALAEVRRQVESANARATRAFEDARRAFEDGVRKAHDKTQNLFARFYESRATDPIDAAVQEAVGEIHGELNRLERAAGRAAEETEKARAELGISERRADAARARHEAATLAAEVARMEQEAASLGVAAATYERQMAALEVTRAGLSLDLKVRMASRARDAWVFAAGRARRLSAGCPGSTVQPGTLGALLAVAQPTGSPSISSLAQSVTGMLQWVVLRDPSTLMQTSSGAVRAFDAVDAYRDLIRLLGRTRLRMSQGAKPEQELAALDALVSRINTEYQRVAGNVRTDFCARGKLTSTDFAWETLPNGNVLGSLRLESLRSDARRSQLVDKRIELDSTHTSFTALTANGLSDSGFQRLVVDSEPLTRRIQYRVIPPERARLAGSMVARDLAAGGPETFQVPWTEHLKRSSDLDAFEKLYGASERKIWPVEGTWTIVLMDTNPAAGAFEVGFDLLCTQARLPETSASRGSVLSPTRGDDSNGGHTDGGAMGEEPPADSVPPVSSAPDSGGCAAATRESLCLIVTGLFLFLALRVRDALLRSWRSR